MSNKNCNRRKNRPNGARWWFRQMRAVIAGYRDVFPDLDYQFSTPQRLAEAQRLARERKDDYRPEDDR